MESPIPSPAMPKKTVNRKISAPAICNTEARTTSCVESEEVASEAASKTKVPCEFCNEPCTLEALMRHQVSAESDKIFA